MPPRTRAAACTVLGSDEDYSDAFRTLVDELILHGPVRDSGTRGELCSRLLLLLARDYATELIGTKHAFLKGDRGGGGSGGCDSVGIAQHITWRYHERGRTTIAGVEDMGHSRPLEFQSFHPGQQPYRESGITRLPCGSLVPWGGRTMRFQPVRARRISSWLLWRIGRGFWQEEVDYDSVANKTSEGWCKHSRS